MVGSLTLRHQPRPSANLSPIVSIIYGALWIQLQLMMNGVASGSIIIEYGSASTQGPGNRMEEFELQNRVRLIEAYLASGRNVKTHPVQQHQRLQASGTEDSSLLFDWPLLVYVVAAIKSAVQSDAAASPSLLDEPGTSQSPEIVTLARLRDALGSELNIGSDPAARHLLAHLHAVGLLRRVDRKVVLLNADEEPARIFCAFPIPLLIDTSVDVEALVTTIEAGLEEIDLSLNEQVLLLLVLRCWPTIWASEYGLERLAQALLAWICTEVRNLNLATWCNFTHPPNRMNVFWWLLVTMLPTGSHYQACCLRRSLQRGPGLPPTGWGLLETLRAVVGMLRHARRSWADM